MSHPAPVTSYDEVPYPAGAYAQSHPGRLETLARLFGVAAPDIRQCRVLELGCADGSNLIPMACALPGSTFLGIDLSQRQVQRGHELIDGLGLRNIELRHLDLQHAGAGLGTFDYIIAHGVYSWVPSAIQEKMLQLCQEHLNPSGVAYISYNTYPGWRMRGMLRDMMLYHSRKFQDVQEQIDQARALIHWLGQSVQVEDNAYGLLLKSELEQMERWQDTYFRHDSLEEINDPVYFHQFAERAEAHGLQYLAEAEFPTMISSNYAEPINETLNQIGRNIIETEQYMDFLRNRMFRQTLLCHRNIQLNRALGPWSVFNLHVAARLKPVPSKVDYDDRQPVSFRGPNELTLSTNLAIAKAAFVCLGHCWPATLPFADLLHQACSVLVEAGALEESAASGESHQNPLGSALLTAFSKGLCELHAEPSLFARTAGELPTACPLVRWKAARGTAVINRRHERVVVDSFDQQFLPLLDGTRHWERLADDLTALAVAGTLVVKSGDEQVTNPEKVRSIMAAQVPERLAQYARFALLEC